MSCPGTGDRKSLTKGPRVVKSMITGPVFAGRMRRPWRSAIERRGIPNEYGRAENVTEKVHACPGKKL